MPGPAMQGAGSFEPSALVGSDIAFVSIAEVWFELLADGADAADLAAGPRGGSCGGDSAGGIAPCQGAGAGSNAAGGASSSNAPCAGASWGPGGRGGAVPPLLDLMSGVQLSEGILGLYTPSPIQEPTHLEIFPGLGGPFDGHAGSGSGFDAADAAGGGGRPSTRLGREEWLRMMRGCREAWGPSLFLRKAVTAVGPHGGSLLGRLVVLGARGCCVGAAGATFVDGTAATAGALTLLRATGRLGKDLAALHAFLRCALPDGEALVNSPHLKELLLLVRHAQAPAAAAAAAAPLPPLPWPPEPLATLAVEEAEVAASASHEALAPPPPPPPPPLALPFRSVDVDVMAALLCEPHDRVGTDLVEGSLRQPVEPVVTDGVGQCCICFEPFPAEQLRHCGRQDCGKSAYCLQCLRRHAEVVVADGLYAVPCVRCPSCNKRLATEAWTPLVGSAALTKYRENARALLTYRCAACDETSSYLANSSPARDPFAAAEPDVRARLLEAWRKFFLGDCLAEDFLQAIFKEHGCAHRTGGGPPTRLSRVFGPSGGAPWVADLERRLAVQLAWMHRFPRQRTPCCGEHFCFRCKVSSWHRGISCRERLQAEKARQAQACPGCSVPTQRSEGCRKITCVCGHSWNWESDESSEEGAFSDDGSDEEDVNQAQTVLNLIAMNTSADKETISEAIQILVEARADLNASTSGMANTQAPLFVAIQYRHPTAAAVLCSSGARVTQGVLDEVKTISHEGHRRGLEEILRPQVRGDANFKLPLWVWVQSGCAPAVEALLRNAAHEEEIGMDVMLALHRSTGDEESRQKIASNVREQVGDERYQELEVSAATRRLLAELRQAYDEERRVDVECVRDALQRGADPNAREDAVEDGFEASSSRHGLSGLGLLAMNFRADAASVVGSIEALIGAGADVNIYSDEASTPLVAALQHRNIPAIGALCRGQVRFTAELLDEVKTISEPSRRQQVEDALRPLARDSVHRRLPLWVWVQDGDAALVEALISREDATHEVDVDVCVALQRSRGDEACRAALAECLRRRVGAEDFDRLQAAAATRRLLQELREAYDDQRSVALDIIRETLALGASASAQEEDEEFDTDMAGSYSLSALQLLVTNTYVETLAMHAAVTTLLEAKADVNMGTGDSPLLSALQHRCALGVEALARHGAKVTPDVFEEVKNISGTTARHQVEDMLKPLIDRDKSLRCPLWTWVQAGASAAVEALLRNAAHDEEVDADVMMALQRCRGDEATKLEIAARIQEHVGEKEFQRLAAIAATRRLLLEVREAHSEERNLELEVLRDALGHGANPNAREEALDDPGEELEDEEEEEEAEDEEEEDDDEEDEDGEDEEEGGEGEDEGEGGEDEAEDEEPGEGDGGEEEEQAIDCAHGEGPAELEDDEASQGGEALRDCEAFGHQAFPEAED